jgi:sugar phosphate isomerase/epimerase
MPGKDEILECFEHAPKAGYKAWGVAGPLFWTPGLVRWADVDLIDRRAKEAGLDRCTEVYGPPFPTSSVAAAENHAASLALIAEAAQKMRSPLVVFTGGRRRSKGLEATIAGIKRLLPLIADKPVKLAIEPHYRTQIENRADYDQILSEINTPKVGITIDIGHFHSAGVDWQALIRAYPDRIYNVHVKDHVGTQSVPIGAGEIDLRGLIEELHATNYNGALAVELEVVDPENLPRYCAEAYTYLRDLVESVTGKPPE